MVGLTAGGTAAFTPSPPMQTFVRQTAGFSDIVTTYVIAASLIFALILQPLYGALSDRIGRKPLLVFFGVAGAADRAHPVHAGADALALHRLPADLRRLGLHGRLHLDQRRGEGRAVPNQHPRHRRGRAVCGDRVDLRRHGAAIALWFKQQGHEQWFYYYLAGVIFLSLLVYATMRDTRRESAMHRHE